VEAPLRRSLLTLALLAGLAAPLAAQVDTTIVRPGMSEADVRARWGEPAAVRRANDWTFLYFANGMERSVGWYDLVFLQNGQVVNAIARGAGHTYAGQSSSPPGRPAEPTRRPEAANPNQPGAMTGVRVNP
jgi:hypothetical protein